MVAGCEQEATVEVERQVGKDVVTRDLRLCEEHAELGEGTL